MTKKLLFLTYSHSVEHADTGIGKKVKNQFSELGKYFEESYISGQEKNKYHIYDTEYSIPLNGFVSKRKRRLNLTLEFIRNKKITHVYVRYTHFADGGFIIFLSKIKKLNCKVILEIPTYPYDKEYKKGITKHFISHIIEKKYRNKMIGLVDYIVTFSDDKEIYGIPCINISNGINLAEISLINNEYLDEFVFSSVSSLESWHGIDRFLNSLEQYLEKYKNKSVKFNIIGKGSEINNLKKIVDQSKNLSEVVVFHGFKSGEELNSIYNKTNIGVGCLGNHRKGIFTIQALKNKEYAAKGLPMIFSEDDPGLRDKEYVYRATHDEQLVDIADVIEWYQNLKITPEQIRESVKEFSWESQMKKVIDKINEL